MNLIECNNDTFNVEVTREPNSERYHLSLACTTEALLDPNVIDYILDEVEDMLFNAREQLLTELKRKE